MHLVILFGLYSSYLINASCVKVLSFGDWGTTTFGEELQSWANEVAGDGVNVAGCTKQASGLLLLGDNFYENGVSSTSDIKFQTLYENQFNSPNLQAIPEHWVTVGNHDHYTFLSGSLAGTGPQKEYSNVAGTKWEFPTDYYTKTLNQNGVNIFFVIIETWNLVGGDSWLPFQNVRLDTTQLSWIETQLASPAAQQADWLIVVGHYPVRTAQKSFARGDTSGLVRNLEPLLKRYGVDAYINGHDHYNQIIDRSNHGFPVYYGNGASGKRDCCEINQKKIGLTFVVEDSLGFHTHVFTKTQLATTIHYKLKDGVRKTYTHIQTQNPGPRSDFDCTQFSCGATCAQYKELGCAWSSTANPPKFKGPGGKGTCILNWDKDTAFWEKNDGVCTSAVLAEAEIGETDDGRIDEGLVAGLVSGFAFIFGLVAFTVIRRRRRQQREEEKSAHSSFSSKNKSISSLPEGAVVSENPLYLAELKV